MWKRRINATLVRLSSAEVKSIDAHAADRCPPLIRAKRINATDFSNRFWRHLLTLDFLRNNSNRFTHKARTLEHKFNHREIGWQRRTLSFRCQPSFFSIPSLRSNFPPRPFSSLTRTGHTRANCGKEGFSTRREKFR